METGVVISAVQTIGLGAFFWYLIRGLKARISGLEGVISAQKATIDVMERRIQETEGVGRIYKNLLSDLPGDIEKYKTLVSQTKDTLIVELQNRNQDAEKKLERAEAEIRASMAPPDQIALHLRVLKRLLGVSKNIQNDRLDLASVCEFHSRKLEDCIPPLISSETLGVFLASIGYRLEVTEHRPDTDEMFKSRSLKNGEELLDAMATDSIYGWYVMANNYIWVSPEMHSRWKDEFSKVKTVE
ncbi:hypothetical protein J2X02_001828 [Pseudoxanthomonas japonensis]|uniref:hypothetical protein n=1 Tax=Pseudoxanthomonas japonensis TaxID=69284 RepID=UPI002865FCFA|nr:hypothetical protein [Pseudoxanthomonas japonensis]MDR7068977.1 hypothetical protein [Pseudoxanthomonas japonensis]